MPRVHSQRLIVAAIALAMLLAMPAFAYAAPAVTSVTPPDGGTASGTWNPAVTVQLSADCTLSPSVTIRIDGKAYSRPVTYATSGFMDWSSGSPVWVVTRDYTRGSASLSSSPLAPGAHTIVTDVTDVLGGSSSRTTSFTLVPPTVLSSPRPAPGSVVTTDLPEISAAIDPRYTPQVSFTLDGKSVSWRYDAAGKRIGLVPQALSNAATHTASVRWFDGAGRESTLVWSFRTQFTCFTQITNMTPAEGAIVADPAPITFVVSDPVGISGAATLLVDGTPATVTTAAIATGKSMRVTMASRAWSEGTHTVVAAAWDRQGSSTSRAWSFKGALPLRLSSLTPASGSFVSSATPRLSVDVSTSVGGVVGTFTIGTFTVPGVFDAARGRLVATSPALADETRYTLKVTARDASAKTVTLSSTFSTRLYATGPSAECVVCHAGYPAVHPVDDCDACHHHGAFYGQKCTVCHASRTPHDTTKLYRALCTDCHGVGDPYVPQHPADLDGVHSDAADFDECSACHLRPISIEHPLHTDAGGRAYDCYTCHGAGVRQDVKDAVAASRTECAACHSSVHVATGSFPGGAVFSVTRHGSVGSSVLAAVSWPGSSLPAGNCANCHGTAAITRPAGNALCYGCHDAVGTVKPSAYSYQGATTYTASAHGASGSAGPCGACHAVHGAKDASGAVIAGALSASDPRLCTGTLAQPGCHASPSNAANGTNILAAIEASKAASTHHDVTASGSDHIVCSSCHDPHTNTAGNPYSDPAAIGKSVPNATDRFRDSSGRVFALFGAQHDAAAPVVSSLGLTGNALTPTLRTVSWSTNEAATGILQYGATASYGSTLNVTFSPTTVHTGSITFPVGTVWHYRARVVDSLGNVGYSADQTYYVPWTYLTVAPTVTGGLGGVPVRVAWKTLGACESWVDYGPTSGYGSTTGTTALDATHSVTVPGLTPGVWHLRARSIRGGDSYTSGDLTTVVYPPAAIAPTLTPIASNLAIPGPLEISFGWTQPDTAGAPFTYELHVWDPSNPYDYRSAWLTSNSATLTLDGDHTYYWQVQPKDKDGTLYPPASSSFTLTYEPASSCPNLFTWNGEKFDYVTDVMGLGPIGVKKSATTYMKPEPVEDTVIPDGKLVARDGKLDLRLTDERAEIEFVDEVKLRAVDHPAGTRLLINDLHWGTSDGGRAATEYHTITAPQPVGVTYERLPVFGTETIPPTDISDKVAVEGDGKLAMAGLYDDNRWVFDLGELEDPAKVKLVVSGWVDYANKAEKAAWVASRKTAPKAVIEVQDVDGSWIEIGDAPHPPGYTKTVVYDLSGKFPEGVTRYRVRMRMYMPMHLDWAAVDTSPDQQVEVTEMSATSASLSYKGLSAYTESPYPTFDYGIPGNRVMAVQTGAFTRLGDVTKLVRAPDDMFVVMSPGDDLAVSFDAGSAPAAGMTRSYVIHMDGFHQTVTGRVDPMPFHAMSGYPYPADESYPSDPRHAAYLAEWNTRVIGAASAVPSPVALPDALARLQAMDSVPHGSGLPVPAASEVDDTYSVDTDWAAVQVVYESSSLTTAAAAGWQSASDISARPTPAAPGAPVSAATLAQASTVNSTFWRTDLATIDRSYNWQIAQFNVPTAALVGAKRIKLSWTGHGEPTVGYPTVVYIWDFLSSQWVQVLETVNGSTFSFEHTERQGGLDTFCLTCHRLQPPAGASGASAFADMSAAWSVDRHGDGTGTGYGGTIKAPYARGQSALSCKVCHDSHGSSNVMHLNETINGSGGIAVKNGVEVQNACVACHSGTINDWHGPCVSCHMDDGNTNHWGDATGLLPTTASDCSACHGHGKVWVHPVEDCHSSCHGWSPGTWRTF